MSDSDDIIATESVSGHPDSVAGPAANDDNGVSGVRLETARPNAAGLDDEQRHHLRQQIRHTRLGIIDQRFSIALKALTAVVGVLVAGAFVWMAWDASEASGLVIEPFSVPADLAERGLTGQVVASKLLDHLAQMEGETDSQRDPRTYARYWGDDIKVEIPDTGISLNELDRYLRARLGHVTHITGDLVRDGDHLSLTAREGAQGSATVMGEESDVDGAVQRLAEAVYRITEPYRYGIWLLEHGRRDESVSVFAALTTQGPATERAWGYLGWGIALDETQGAQARLAIVRKVIASSSDMVLGDQNLAVIEESLGQQERALADFRACLPKLASSTHGLIRPDMVENAERRENAFIDMLTGSFRDATPLWQQMVAFGAQGNTYSANAMLARSALGEHDIATARGALRTETARTGLNVAYKSLDLVWARMQFDGETRHSPAVLADESDVAKIEAAYPGLASYRATRVTPWLAYAHARMGDMKSAEAMIATTPADCYICLRMRARIAELKGDHTGADAWFTKAAESNPSIPLADSEWGEALLARGQVDAAIAKFGAAHEVGPKFADPLEGWGEALLAQKNYGDAADKFEAANEFAPRWGRLHLKWGEALAANGDREGANKQFALATTLDLTQAEQVELARLRAPDLRQPR